MLMNIKQVEQISTFLSAYPKDVAEAGIEAWRTGEIPENKIQDSMEGRVTDVQVDKKYTELTEETKQFLREQSEKMTKLMPFCKCGKQFALMGVCPSCPKYNEGYRSKYVCSCGFEEFFKQTVYDKIVELKGGM